LQNSFHEVLVRSFQLAFSLWNISLKEGELLIIIKFDRKSNVMQIVT